MSFKSPITGKTYLKKAEVAELAGVTAECIASMAQRGALTTYKRRGSNVNWFDLDEINAWLTPEAVPVQERRHQDMTPRQVKASGRRAAKRVRQFIDARG